MKNFRSSSEQLYLQGIGYALASAFFYGLMGMFSTKLYSFNISTDAMLFWRFLLASMLIITISPQVVTKISEYKQKEYYSLFLISFICFTGSSWLYFEATKIIGTGLAITIFFCFPIFVILYSYFFDNIKISKDIIIAIIILIIGLLLIHDNHGMNSNKINQNGIIISVISGFFYASYLFFSKKFCPDVKGLKGTLMVCLGNAIACLILALFQRKSILISLNLEISIYIFCLSFFSTVLPIFFLVKALKILSATKVAILTMLEPLTTLLIGVILLGEIVNDSKIIGIILILASSLIISLSKRN